MRQKSGPEKQPAEDAIRDIRRATRRHFSAEEKIRILLEGLRGEESIAELCRREGIASSRYYGWSKEFLEAGKRRLAGGSCARRHPHLFLCPHHRSVALHIAGALYHWLVKGDRVLQRMLPGN